MGGCCGKGAAPKDPDKTPYSPAARKPENVDKPKEKTPLLQPGDVSAPKGINERTDLKELETPKQDAAKPEADTDSFVIIELDKESKPQVIEPTKAAQTDNGAPAQPPKASPPKATPPKSTSPSRIPAREKSPPAKVSPVTVPKDSPKEQIFSPRPVDGEAKLPELVVTPIKEVPDKRDVTLPKEDGAKKLQEPSQKSAGLPRQEAVTIDHDESSTSSFDDSIVATPDVVLRIDEPGRDIPASPEKKSPLASPTKKSPTVSGIARPTFSTFGIPKSSVSTEEAPDPKTIIENVRNKAKDGNYTVESHIMSKKETTSAFSSGAVTSKTTTVVTTVKETVDSNQNKEDSKGIVETISTKSPEIKEEITTTKTEIVSKRESPARVSKLPSPTGSAAPVKKQDSPEPVSPKRESAPSGLKMPTIVTRPGSRSSPEQTPKPTSPEPATNKTIPSTPETKQDIKPTVKDAQETQVVNGKTDAESKTTQPSALDSSPVYKTDKTTTEAIKTVMETPSRRDRESTSSTSSQSSKSPLPSKPADTSHYSMVNGVPSTRVEREVVLLPDFTKSNAAVTKRHRYCTNTRMQALAAVDKWMKDSSPEKSRVMVIKGEPGMGKTTLMTEISKKYAQNLAAYHYFNYNSYDLNHNDFKYTLLWLVKTFIQTIDTFEDALPERTDIEKVVNSGSIDDVTQQLIATPLKSETLKHDPSNKMLIVMDALDECDIADREKLFEFVDNFSSNTPEWLQLCVSFRTDNQLENFITTADVIELKNNNDNTLDIKRMMKESLGNFMDRISLDGGLQQLAKKAHGLPLCASLYNRILDSMDKKEKIALREIDIKFATNLDGVLSNELSAFKKSIDSDKGSEQKYANLIGMLALARQPINQTFLSKVGFKDATHTLEQLKAVVDVVDNDVVIVHKVIAEWLLDVHKGGDLGVDVNVAKSNAATNCANWLEPLIGESTQMVPQPLTEYAVKHSVSHFTDKPKEQENVGKALCSLRVIQQKLEIGGIDSVMRDYRHEHEQMEHSHKRIVLHDYVKKVPKLEEQVRIYKSFLKDNYIHLKYAPSSLNQLAANYTRAQRIQSNARIELTSAPWLEDLTAVQETHCSSKSFIGTIVCADLSPDGKTIAFVTKDKDSSVHLHQYLTQTLEPKVPFVDITQLEGRLHANDCCKYLPDGLHIFVGSLDAFINTKGKPVPTGYDVASTQLKEKAAVERCSVSSKYLAVSLTTFPFNGRSVHLAVFGVKEKKALKTLEVLKFRFGGNAQFGVKGCALSPDEKLLAACIKQNNKHEMKVNIWGIGKWNIVHTLDLSCETINQCEFGEIATLLLNVAESTSNRCLAWKTAPGEKPITISDEGSICTISVNKSHIAVCSTNTNTGNAKLKKWKKTQAINQEPANTFRINGLGHVSSLLMMHSNMIVCEEQTIKTFDPSDLDDITGDDAASSLQLCDMNVESIAFMPRSDTMVTAATSAATASVYTCENFGEDLQVTDTPLTGPVIGEDGKRAKVFGGKTLSTQRAFVSNDGSSYILNVGNKILLWSTSNDQVEALSFPPSVGADSSVSHCLPSPKESIVAVVYSQCPHVVFVHDLKTKQMVKQIELVNMNICDISFLPSTGYVLTYHEGDDNKLAIWNQRTGKHVDIETVDLSFVKVSQSSDRLLLSKSESGVTQLQLRSSDNKISVVLNTDQSWSGSSDKCDAEFSPDGTVLVGVDIINNLCRIWNAGNGDVLKDMTMRYRQAPFIVGLPTNTHVAICDSRISVLDIASGETLCVCPITCAYTRDHCQLSVSPRGNIIAGTTANGMALVYRLHNFAAIKMKTTLQRIKSFRA